MESADVLIVKEALRQRRRLQNRRNQRAHRHRHQPQDPAQSKKGRPFLVTRWRLDEDDVSADSIRTVAKSESGTLIRNNTKPMSLAVTFKAGSATNSSKTSGKILTPPTIIFPLSTDHLLHLLQYNTFRAFATNKNTLNFLFTGSHTNSNAICPISGRTICMVGSPSRNITNNDPLNPNIPSLLFPTALQRVSPHSFFIDIFPFPEMRDNLLRRELQGKLDVWGLLADLIGELLGGMPTEERQGIPTTVTLSDPETTKTRVGDDDVTAGSKGLIVWGEPHVAESWEATPGFFEKWGWVAEGCRGLIASTNRWRERRGEEPLLFPG